MGPIEKNISVSLVIPVRNESGSLRDLVSSIGRQKFQPEEVIVVDGGSTDDSVEVATALAAGYPKLKIIETSGAMPGEGRNIGIREARCEWVALTDAGITLTEDWLEQLVSRVTEEPDADIVYGNYAPVTDTLFTRIAAVTYVPAQLPETIRGTTIASYLMRKAVWEKAGGFPDARAAEDLAFMEAAEEAGFVAVTAPKAMVHWQLCPTVFGTFRRFVLYSKHNVWAGRAWDWHYGIARQYLLVLPFLIVAVFHSLWWLTALPLWLGARTLKRILPHRHGHGNGILDPRIWMGVSALTLVVDAATFLGWLQALSVKKDRDG